MGIRAGELPPGALLARYRASPERPGNYTDCYRASLAARVSLEDYVRAFYTTPLFRAERWILAILAKRPSTDGDVDALVEGRGDRFAAWSVEARADDQLLMCDMRGRTRSWFMVRPAGAAAGLETELLFGSAVVAQRRGPEAEAKISLGMRLLLGFHKLYSRALLAGAVRRLARRPRR